MNGGVPEICGAVLLFAPGPCALVTQDLCAKKKPPAHPVNLKTATADELQQVPGSGPSTVQKILQARKSYGAFKSVDDLQAIRRHRSEAAGEDAKMPHPRQTGAKQQGAEEHSDKVTAGVANSRSYR